MIDVIITKFFPLHAARLEFRCKIRVHTRGLVPEASPCDQSLSVCLALLIINTDAQGPKMWSLRLVPPPCFPMQICSCPFQSIEAS